MAHSVIIIEAKLKCVSENFEEVQPSAENLNSKCQAADAFLQNPPLGTPQRTIDDIHETLELVQGTATDWCDNGTNLSQAQMIEILDDYAETLDDLIS